MGWGGGGQSREKGRLEGSSYLPEDPELFNRLVTEQIQ